MSNGQCYISRVESGYTVPALETLEKIARALETPLYQLFYTDEETPPDAPMSLRVVSSNVMICWD